MQVRNPILPVKFQNWNCSPRPAAVEAVSGTIKTGCPYTNTPLVKDCDHLTCALLSHGSKPSFGNKGIRRTGDRGQRAVARPLGRGKSTVYLGNYERGAPVGISRADWNAEASEGG